MRARAMSKTDLSNVDGFFQRQNTMETSPLETWKHMVSPLDTFLVFFGVYRTPKRLGEAVKPPRSYTRNCSNELVEGKSWKIYWEQSGNQLLTPT